ncbi:MAG TPA: galactokinase [Kineosporiaceae bacterium]|nr:galactokinase [Kineosporiaceae bacterium]
MTSTAAGAVTWYPDADPAEAAEKVRRSFAAVHGRTADGVWAAPGRVNLIGEHVDYNAGLCLPLALPQRTFAAVGIRDDGLVRVHSAQARGRDWSGRLDEAGPGRVPGWAGYAVGVAWALRQDGFDVPGFDLAVDGYVPLGSGLSSSAAVECAVAIALDELLGLGLGGSDEGRARLAAACVRAENEVAGAPTGGMDQATSLRARAGEALLLDCRDFAVRPVPFELAALGLELLVMDTRAHHTLVDGQYGSRRDECGRAAGLLGVDVLRDLSPDALADALDRLAAATGDDALAAVLQRRTRHVVTEIARVSEAADLLRAGRAGELGPLLDASHTSLRDDYEVSCTELDCACEAALAAGALGARMTGGGFGGSAIALVAADTVPQVAAAVHEAAVRAGLHVPAFLRARPAAGASRVG